MASLGEIKQGISAYTKKTALESLYKVPVIGGVVEERNESKDKSFVTGAKNYAAGKMKDTLFNLPVIGGIAKQVEIIKRKQEDSSKEEQDVQAFKQLSNTSSEQVDILQKTNIVLTQISDNVYNIAGKLGAELSSLEDVKRQFKERAKQEAIDKQKALGKAEESSLEAKQAVQVGSDNKPKSEDKKPSGGLFDFLKTGKLPIKDIIQSVLKGGLSFLKTAGGFLMRGLTLFTNPIGIAVAIVGTIGYGIYKYFTDDEFKGTVDNLFESAKKFIAEKFGQAGSLFGEYIVDPVVNFLSSMKDRVIDWIVSVLKGFENVPLVGKIVKPSIEALEKAKSSPNVASQTSSTASVATPSATDIPKAGDKQPSMTAEENAALDADITKYVTLKDSSIDLAGMDPAVKKRLAAVAYEYFNNTGKKIQINSAFRDPKEQAELFAKYGSPRAARPGKSKHEVGLAFDMNSADANKAVGLGLFDKYGFQRPIASEPWHVEAKEARNSVPDNPLKPGQAVLVSNGGKPTIPSGGVAVNENQLKQAMPAGGGAETSQTASDLPSAEPVKTGSSQSASMAADSGSESSAKSAAAPAEPVSAEPSTGTQVAQASMDVEQGYGNQQPVVSNVDNSSSSMSSTEQGTRFQIPSPVANRGSLDKMSFSYA